MRLFDPVPRGNFKPQQMWTQTVIEYPSLVTATHNSEFADSPHYIDTHSTLACVGEAATRADELVRHTAFQILDEAW